MTVPESISVVQAFHLLRLEIDNERSGRLGFRRRVRHESFRFRILQFV